MQRIFWKRSIFTILFFLFFLFSYAQRQSVNTFLAKLKEHAQEDTVKVNLLQELSFYYHTICPDSTIYYGRLSLELSKQLNYTLGIANSYKHLAIGEYVLGNRSEALLHNQSAAAMYREKNDENGLAAIYNNMAIILHNEGKYELAKAYYDSSLVIRIRTNHLSGIADSYNNLGNLYTDQDKYSEALDYLFKALRIREKLVIMAQ